MSVKSALVNAVHQPDEAMSGLGRKDVTSSPTVGRSQRPARTMSAMWSGLRPRNATIREEVDSRGRTAIVSAAVVRRHETTASLRNRRICQIITGMIRASITIATAAP